MFVVILFVLVFSVVCVLMVVLGVLVVLAKSVFFWCLFVGFFVKGGCTCACSTQICFTAHQLLCLTPILNTYIWV